MTKEFIYTRIKYIIDIIVKKEKKILICLQKTETYKTAKNELEKSILCLKNIDKQMKFLSRSNFKNLCVFLPINQPLYSLILFVVIPGCMFKRIICRPPVLVDNIYMELFSILELDIYNIFCKGISRRDFIQQYVKFANGVIYAGKYENALEVIQQLSPNTIFIFQGSGTNPIIITDNANVDDQLISKVVKSQIYNSGQDCMAPAAVFVAESKWCEFVKMLNYKLDNLQIGNYNDVGTDIAPIIDYSVINKVKMLLDSNRERILRGGEIDYENKIIFPTIIEFKDIYNLPFGSYFSPIFCLYCYKKESEIVKFLEREECQENRAYVSVFGSTKLSFKGQIVINDDVLDSVDVGYTEFGGFGVRSGFVSYNGIRNIRPILISREFSRYFEINGEIIPIGDLEKPIYEANIVISSVNLLRKNVLEIGCGCIPHAKLLAPYCKKYVAVDINENKIVDAITKNNLENLEVRRMDGTKLQYNDETFDFVFMFHALHEVSIEKQGHILQEIYRVLNRNGYLCIIDSYSEQESEFQKCFNIIHETFFDYKHILGVKHADWIINKYVERKVFSEYETEEYKMIFSFGDIQELKDCLIESFKYEYDWDEKAKQKLIRLLFEKYNLQEKPIYLEEKIIYIILKRNNK